MSLATSVSSTVIAIFCYYYYFNNDYKNIKPNYKYFNFTRATKLLGKSSIFFIIQISALILFMSDNLIITKLFNPEDVVPYNIAYKLFNIVVVFFSIITTPLWAAITDANHKNDLIWIENTISKLKKIWYLTSIGLISILLLSNQIYKYWIGQQVNIPISISISMCLFVLVHTYNTIYVTYIFAVGKTRIQAFTAIIAAIINIPLSIFFAKFLNIGPAGVILATAICGLPNIYISRLQYYKIKNKIDKGNWSK
jgi:O-antigen/teichoic acid export membrane protein